MKKCPVSRLRGVRNSGGQIVLFQMTIVWDLMEMFGITWSLYFRESASDLLLITCKWLQCVTFRNSWYHRNETGVTSPQLKLLAFTCTQASFNPGLMTLVSALSWCRNREVMFPWIVKLLYVTNSIWLEKGVCLVTLTMLTVPESYCEPGFSLSRHIRCEKIHLLGLAVCEQKTIEQLNGKRRNRDGLGMSLRSWTWETC